MSKPTTVRRYGKQSKKLPRAGRLFVELPQTPIRTAKTALLNEHGADDEVVEKLALEMSTIQIQDENIEPAEPPLPTRRKTRQSVPLGSPEKTALRALASPNPVATTPKCVITEVEATKREPSFQEKSTELQVLSWAEVCPPGDSIVKIAEASYAEVYRVTNDRGTSIIKVIRMSSPIKPQTKTQQKSGLVDEEPHSESDLQGELRISEWVADIPGFVVYKERYVVQGKACRELLETHQAFHKKLKRQDPDRLQFYPSPSRYLDDTKFLAVELGDAGTALEDFGLATADQLWDIFFHVTIALARAEARIGFEVCFGKLFVRRGTYMMLTHAASRSSRGKPVHPKSRRACPQGRTGTDRLLRLLRPRDYHLGLRSLPSSSRLRLRAYSL
jgi:serine/threonine-protein kinase haspin